MFDDLSYKTTIRDFDVELCLSNNLPAYYRNMQKSGTPIPKEYTDENWYWATSKVTIQSARNEDMTIPMPQTIDGRKSYEERRRYFKERKPAYQQAAWDVLDRAVRFFKYRLHNPNLSLVNQYNNDFQNPIWIDESGNEIKDTEGIIVVTSLSSLNRFGVRFLSRHDDTDLVNALQNPISPDLIEQLLSDAQSAVFQGNLRRFVLETAIACETAVKQTFFAKATPSGAAYEYFEDKGKVHVSIPELIHSVAKQAFGKSFKEDEESHYNNIDFLFRCRNKVAHRGELIYRDGSGILHPVDKDKLEEWWESVTILRAWLLAKAKEQEETKPT
ncbi:MAG: hypothetical protein NTU95_06430 [Methanothrix sp.]|nr:hypothetical protein [Methanothrix sp.]